MHATRSLDRYVSMVEVIDNNQIIFTKGKGRRMGAGGSENDKKETPTSKSTRVYSDPSNLSVEDTEVHATRALERYVSMFEVIDNKQIIFTKGKEGGGAGAGGVSIAYSLIH